MIVPDVNVLVYAYREDVPESGRYRRALENMVTGHEPLGLAAPAVGGFLRIVTHPQLFNPATPLARALDDMNELLERRNVVRVEPGPRHWSIFDELCRATHTKGNDIPDAWLAAIALELGAEVATADRGFARFPGVRWRDPAPA